MIAFSCDKCGKQYKLKPEFAGRKTQCTACKEPMQIPHPEAKAAPVSPPPAAAIAPAQAAKIAFTCSKCDMKFSVNAEFAGRATKCPTCKEALVVPTPDQTVAYAPTIGQIKGAPSSLAKVGVDAGVTLGHDSGTNTEHSGIEKLIEGKTGDGARYIVESEIARGGMGAVLRAVDCDIRREVAVKYLLDQSDSKKKLRFVEEAQITGQLEHPNIVPIHELGVDSQQRVFFSMKMVKGRSLGEIIQTLRTEPKKKLEEYSLTKLLGIFVNICNALAYAHSRGVVHRDLKPANIMVGDFGEVYVMDWGLAKVLKRGAHSPETGPVQAIPVASLAIPVASVASGDASVAPFEVSRQMSASAPIAVPVAMSGTAFSAGSGQVITSREIDADLTQEGAVLGTPVYMPPEQATGQINNIDERSDIYSMGAILYEMMALQPPISKEGGFWPILMRVTQGEIELPEKKNPQRARAGLIPAELSAVAMKALAKRKEDRYQRIEDLRKDIELFLEGRSVSAKEDTRKEMIIKFVKRNQAFSAATSAAAVLLFVVVSWALYVNFQERRATQRAYDAYAGEQKEKAERTRRAVPALVEIARRDAEARQFKKALEQARLALEYDPDHLEGRLLLGQLLIVHKEFKAASAELATYLKRNPKDDMSATLKEWCDKAQGEKTDQGAVMQLGQTLAAQNYPGMAEGVLQHYAKSGDEFRAELLKLYRGRIEAAWPGRGQHLSLDKDGHFHMQAHGDDIKHLAPLKDIPLRTVILTSKQVRDLSELRGMPLVRVEFHGCNELANLDALKGMRLTSFVLGACPLVTDLSALKGMPLTSFHVTHTAMRDLKGLQGMPLKTLSVDHGQLEDLTGLNESPLAYLEIGNCHALRDLTPLKGLPVKSLIFKNCFNLRDITPLKGMPLTKLHFVGCGILQDLSPLEGMPLEELSLSGCTEVRSLESLRNMPLTTLDLTGCNLLTSLKGIERLRLANLTLTGCARITDLDPVKDLPLTSISLGGCPAISDLAALKGKPFTTLDISGTKITDLTPLKGMPLNVLKMNDCPLIEDLSPLRGIQLGHLEITNCVKIQDLTPLKEGILHIIQLSGCKEVKTLDGLQGMRLSRIDLHECTNLESLDGLKGTALQHLNLSGCSKLENLNILKGMPINNFNAHRCPELSDISGLKGMTAIRDVQFMECPKVADWSPLKGIAIMHLHINNCNIPTLEPLTGCKIGTLNLTACTKINDLSPVKNAEIQQLHLQDLSGLIDLTSLKGMKLVGLSIINCPVKDLSPLKGMPLQVLNLDKCAEVRDVSALASLPLQNLTLPPQSTIGMNMLRKSATLTHINGKTAEQYWVEWDAAQPKGK